MARFFGPSCSIRSGGRARCKSVRLHARVLRVELQDQIPRLFDVPARGGAEDERLDLALLADVLECLLGRNRAAGEDAHGDRAEAPLADRLLVQLEATAHAKVDLV